MVFFQFCPFISSTFVVISFSLTRYHRCDFKIPLVIKKGEMDIIVSHICMSQQNDFFNTCHLIPFSLVLSLCTLEGAESQTEQGVLTTYSKVSETVASMPCCTCTVSWFCAFFFSKFCSLMLGMTKCGPYVLNIWIILIIKIVIDKIYTALYI